MHINAASNVADGNVQHHQHLLALSRRYLRPLALPRPPLPAGPALPLRAAAWRLPAALTRGSHAPLPRCFQSLDLYDPVQTRELDFFSHSILSTLALPNPVRRQQGHQHGSKPL